MGGLAYIGAIANAVPTAANIRRYAACRDRARPLGHAAPCAGVATEIAEAAFNPMGKTSEQLLDEAEGRFSKSLKRATAASREFFSLSDLAAQAIDRVEELYRRDIRAGRHRHGDWLHRSRPHDGGPAGRRPHHRRRSSVGARPRSRSTSASTLR